MIAAGVPTLSERADRWVIDTFDADVNSEAYRSGIFTFDLLTLLAPELGAAGAAAKTASAARSWSAAEDALPAIKAGSSGGPTAGMKFPESVRAEELANNPSTCVYCHMETDFPQIDHVIPRSRGGNATIDNAQTTCPHCNASKGARDFPVTPPGGYEGPWPPPWWNLP